MVEYLNMFHAYVLRSLRNNKRYVGFTSKIIELRLNEHNEGKNSYTRNNRPHRLIYSESFSDEEVARQRKNSLKLVMAENF